MKPLVMELKVVIHAKCLALVGRELNPQRLKNQFLDYGHQKWEKY
jgi:hypothetical protein